MIRPTYQNAQAEKTVSANTFWAGFHCRDAIHCARCECVGQCGRKTRCRRDKSRPYAQPTAVARQQKTWGAWFLLRSVLLLTFILWQPCSPSATGQTRSQLPQVGQPVPVFTLLDAEGKSHSLQEFRKRPVVLFFFCGCVPCHECAQAWTVLQRSGELETRSQTKSPSSHTSVSSHTLIVYTGEATAAKDFLIETGLANTRTCLLTDVQMRVTAQYGAEPCPRVFVVDSQGSLVYTNPVPGADTGAFSAPLLVSRILTTLRQQNHKVMVRSPQSTISPAKKARGTSHAK